MADDLDDFLAWKKAPDAREVVRWLRKMQNDVGVDDDDQVVARVAAAEIERLRAALKPFAEPHAMGDNYVQFAPRLIHAARAALEQKEDSK